MNCIKDSYIFSNYIDDSSDKFYKTFIAGVEDKIEDVKSFVKYDLVNYLEDNEYINDIIYEDMKIELMDNLLIYKSTFNYSDDDLRMLINNFIEDYLQYESERDRLIRLFEKKVCIREFIDYVNTKLNLDYEHVLESWLGIIIYHEDFKYTELLSLKTKEDVENWEHYGYFDYEEKLYDCIELTKKIIDLYNIKSEEEMEELVFKLIKEYMN
jgi:hypothetical protein